MKFYVLNEEQREALLSALELEKHKRSPFLKPEDEEREKQIRNEVHRCFHYHVCKALDS